MYINLNDINDLAERCREEELRKSLRTKIEGYRKGDIVQRHDLESIARQIGNFSIEYLHVIAPCFNGSPPPAKALQEMRQSIAVGQAIVNKPDGKRERIKVFDRVYHNSSIDDYACAWINTRGTAFDPEELADFIVKKANEYREERTTGLTLISLKYYDERLKIEAEVEKQVKNGVYFMKALSAATRKRAESLSRDAQTVQNVQDALHSRELDKCVLQIDNAQLLLEDELSAIRDKRKRIEYELDQYKSRIAKANHAAARP